MKDLIIKGAALGTILALIILSFSLAYAEAPKTAGPKVNINTATQAELEGLPQIGSKIAGQIIQYRTQNGNFKKIEEIMKVKGIGEKLFNQLKDLITVSAEAK